MQATPDVFSDVVVTSDGSLTVRHPTLHETFHSTDGAMLEARSLYIESSGFKEALADEGESRQKSQYSLNVLDIGLGLGYNALATIEAWIGASAPPPLNIVSLEKEPSLVEMLLRGAGPWQLGWPEPWIIWAKLLTPNKDDSDVLTTELCHPRTQVRLKWTVLVGQAEESLKEVKCHAGEIHFFWQDPFSPQMNPKLWGLEWFGALREVAAPSAILASYSVARTVRDALSEAGWNPKRIPTTSGKRNWLLAQPH